MSRTGMGDSGDRRRRSGRPGRDDRASHLSDTQSSRFVEDALEPAERSEAEAHLATCPSCRRDLRDLSLTRSLLHDLPAPVPNRSFRLHRADPAVARRTWQPVPGWAANLVPALPALRSATAGVALLLLAVTAGDLLTQSNEVPQSPRVGQEVPAPTTNVDAGAVAATVPTVTIHPQLVTPTAASIFSAAEAPTAVGEENDETSPSGTGEDPVGPANTGASEPGVTEPDAPERPAAESAGAPAAGRGADQTGDEAVPTETMDADRDGEPGTTDAMTADESATGAAANDAAVERENDAPLDRAVVQESVSTAQGEDPTPPDAGDTALSQAAPAPANLGTPVPPTARDGSTTPVGPSGTPEPSDAPGQGTPTIMVAAPPSERGDDSNSADGDRNLVRFTQVALGLILAAMLGLLGMIGRWERATRHATPDR